MATNDRISVRRYKQEDWPRLKAIHDSARLDELRHTVGAEAFLSLERTFKNEGLFDDQVAVAVVDSSVRGFVAYSDQELTWLYVDPAYYRRGIGRALVRHAVIAAKSAMQVSVLEGNVAALQLYTDEGFTIVERHSGALNGNERFAATGLTLRWQSER